MPSVVRAAEPPPLEVFGKIPNLEQAILSPDGAKLVVIITDGETRHIAVFAMPERRMVMRAPAGKKKLRSII